MKLLCILNIIPSLLLGDESTEQLKSRYNDFKRADTELFWSLPDKGTGGVEQNFQKELGATYVMKQIIEVDESLYDGVVIPCGLDPCLFAAREYLTIPVVGALSSGAHLAALLGRKFSLVHPKSPAATYEELDLIRIYHLEDSLASIRSTPTPLAELGNLSAEQALEEIAVEARRAINEDGADAILLGCGAMEGFDTLSDRLGVPVIDMGIAALKICELMVDCQLTHSKVAYPSPSKAIPWNVFE